MEKSESIKAIAMALNKVQAELQTAKKGSENPFYHSKYADLLSVWDACREPLSKNGLAVTQVGGTDGEGKPILETILLHESGEWIKGSFPLLLTKQDPQGVGSAITYMRRYSLSAILGLCTEEDDDGEAATPKTTPKPVSSSSKPPARTAPDAPQSPTGAPKEALARTHWCKIHNTAFFKTEKMHHYAHPIKDSDPPKWCREPKPPKETQALVNTVNEQERFADECKKLGLTEKQALDLLQVDELSSVKDIEGAIKYLNEYADGEDVSLSKGG